MINYKILKIPCKLAKEYIHKFHYSKSSCWGPSPCFGLVDGKRLIGVMMFAIPCSENVRRSIFGSEYVDRVIELHRLHIKDCTPPNTESWFISRCFKKLKKLKPQLWAVLSFSDLTEGHTGVIYKATNAYRIGSTQPKWFYIDEEGKLRHPRQNGYNIDRSTAIEIGWKVTKRDSKNRYLWLLPDNKKHKKDLIELCKYKLETFVNKVA